MAFESGSSEYYKFEEKAEKIYRKASAARCRDDLERYREEADALINVYRSKYGYNEDLEYLIEQYLERI